MMNSFSCNTFHITLELGHFLSEIVFVSACNKYNFTLSKITIILFQKDIVMSLLELAAAYDSDSDLSNSEEESKVEREVVKVQDPVPPLKRGLDQEFDKEMKN